MPRPFKSVPVKRDDQARGEINKLLAVPAGEREEAYPKIRSIDRVLLPPLAMYLHMM